MYLLATSKTKLFIMIDHYYGSLDVHVSNSYYNEGMNNN